MRFFCAYGWCYPNDTTFYLLITYSCLLSASFRFLSRYYLVTTSIPLHYHPVLSPYFATYLSAFIRWVSPASTPYTKKSHQNAIFFAQSKIIHYLCRRIENMINKKSIRFYNDHKVRAIWSEELNPWVSLTTSNVRLFGIATLRRTKLIVPLVG